MTARRDHDSIDRGRGWRGLAMAIALLVPGPALAQNVRLQLDGLDRLGAKAKDSVNLSIDPAMLQQALTLINGKRADRAELGALTAGLKGIYVRVFEFDAAGAYTDEDVQAVRAQLKTPWTRVVSVREGKELVEVHMWPEGANFGGLTVLVAEPKELVVVNIVGRIDMKILAALQGQLGIPSNLGIPMMGGGGKKD